MKKRRFMAAGVCPWLCFFTVSTPLIALDEILFEETFNDDGEGTRYTSEGRLVSEIDDHPANGVSADQVGPVYWSHSSDVSLVGVPGPTPARRAVITWHHELEREQVTDEALTMVEASIEWLLDGVTNPRVLFSPAPMGSGDAMIVEIIEGMGGTIDGDEDTASALPPASNYDLVVHSSQGEQPSRFTNYPVPYLTFNGPDHDDELVGTIGLSLTQAFPDIGVKSPEHPAAGGVTGDVGFFVDEVRVDAPGTEVPDGSTVVATYPVVAIPAITNLAEVDAMAAEGAGDNVVVDEANIPAADLESGDAGNFSGAGGDNPVPGNPIGSFGTVATGRLTVKEAGTYGFALWMAGGARLRIDTDGNGLDANDVVVEHDDPMIVDDLVQGVVSYGDATFGAAGEFDFEWVSYSPSDIFGSEIYFTFVTGADQRDPVDNQEKWAPLADWEAAGIDVLPINLSGEIAVTKYERPQQVIEERPLIVAINGPDEGGQVFGGGAFIDFEGEGYWAGSALNKFATEVDPKTLTLNPVDLSGEEGPLKLKLLLAATTLDFETSDFFVVKIDPDNSGTFQDLIHFTAPSGNDKFFSDGTTDLNIAFQEVVYDLPEGLSNLVIRIEALTTWWNEVVAVDHIRVVREVEPEFNELWLLGDATNGNQAEFSQEQGMDEAPGSAALQDDDFYFAGTYPDPIGEVSQDEPFTNFDRAHVPGDPFNRIHFNLDAEAAAADTQLRLTFALCCLGAADQGPSEHDLVFRLNGNEFFSEEGVNGDRVIQETVTAGDFDVAAGANTIEIERTGGSDSSWVQYDYVRFEATAGSAGGGDGGGGDGGGGDGGDGVLPDGAYALDAATPTGEGLTVHYWNLPPKTMVTAGEPLHRLGEGPEGADNANSGWADENVYGAVAPSGQFVATTFNYGGNDLTPIDEWLGEDFASFVGTAGNLDDGAFRFSGYVRVDEAGSQTFTTTSDDGSVVYINDQLVVSNDNGHGNATVSGTFEFPAAGYYPIDVRYFNGDWTNDAGEHGGANFIGEAGFNNVVQGLEGVAPLWTPVKDATLGQLPADSVADFGGPEVDNGWQYGYRNVPLDNRTEDYDPVADFIEFTDAWWDGTRWDEPNADGDNVPWTEINSDSTHPNGDNNGELHWTIRRWNSPGGRTEITWTLAKSNVNCGNGVTGGVHVNGVRVDGVAIAGDDGEGMQRTIIVDLQPGDTVDLINSPLGADGTDNDGCDGSLMTMAIDRAPPVGGLEGYWAFDEGEGTSAADGSGNGREASFRNGAASWVEGKSGGALNFDGDDDLTVPGWKGIGGNRPRTVSYWIKTDWAVDASSGTVGWGTSSTGLKWHLRLNNSANNGPVGAVRTEIEGSFHIGTKVINDGQWHHVVSIFPEGGQFMQDLIHYVDGELQEVGGTGNDTVEVNTAGEAEGGTDVTFGSRLQGANDQYFFGDMDEISIWNRALTEAEVLSLNGGVSPIDVAEGKVSPDNDLDVDLVAYYPLDGHLQDGVGDSHGVGKTWVAGGKQDQPELLADHPTAELTFTDGAFGQGVDLDGAGQYIETPLENEERFDFGAPDNPTGFTVSAWFRVDGFTKGWQALVAKGEQNQWRVHRQGETDNLVGNGGNADIGQNLDSVNDGQVHHIALVSDPAAGNVRLYVDGVLREEGAAPALENNPMPMMIGQNPDTDDRTWDGLIDDVALWSRPLSEEEVILIASSEQSLGDLAGIEPGGDGGGGADFDLLNVGLTANGVFTVTIPEGVTADIEYSTDLQNWEVIATGASGVLEETDAARLAAPEGYYRAR